VSEKSVSVRPEPPHSLRDVRVLLAERFEVPVTVHVDDVDLAATVSVHVLEVVDDADYVDGFGDLVGLPEEFDLPVDVVLHEVIDRLAAVQVIWECFDSRFEVGFEQLHTVLDTRWLVQTVGERVVGRRDGAAAGVADHDGGVGAGVLDRVEDVAGDGFARLGLLDDAVADVATGKHLARVVVVPHVVVKHAGVRTADGDDVRVLCVLYVAEPRLERVGVGSVALQQVAQCLVHAWRSVRAATICSGSSRAVSGTPRRGGRAASYLCRPEPRSGVHPDVAALLERSDANYVGNDYEVPREQFQQLDDQWLAAGAVVWNPDGEAAFVEPSWADGWVLPGGSVEAGESIASAAEREVAEETGLGVDLRNACRVVEQRYRWDGAVATGWFVAFAATTPDREFGEELGVHEDEIDRVGWFDGAPSETPEFVDAEALLADCRLD
jgi:8-oxo-dGTP diphosphatase